jgi:cytochrome o ubiquinol oxidase subunit 3
MTDTTAGALPSDISARSDIHDPYRMGRHTGGSGEGHGSDATGRGEGGPASRYVTVTYGFWIFLLSDIIMFSAFFAAYAVLSGGTDGGPTGRDLFDLQRVAIQTGLLLTSSFTCGLGSLASYRRDMAWTQIWLLVTGVLGAAFLALEIQ